MGATPFTLWQSVRKRKELVYSTYQIYNNAMGEMKKDFSVLARFPVSLIRRLEVYRGKQTVPAIPSRSGILRAAVDEYLKARGA